MLARRSEEDPSSVSLDTRTPFPSRGAPRAQVCEWGRAEGSPVYHCIRFRTCSGPFIAALSYIQLRKWLVGWATKGVAAYVLLHWRGICFVGIFFFFRNFFFFTKFRSENEFLLIFSFIRRFLERKGEIWGEVVDRNFQPRISSSPLRRGFSRK